MDRVRAGSITTVAVVVLLLGRVADLVAGRGPSLLPDSPMYLALPDGPALAQVSFLGNMPRPWTVTLPYALIESHVAIVLLQRLLGALAWSLLLVAIGRMQLLRDPFRWLLQAGVVAIALSPIVTTWDPLLQSDSFAMTGTALLCAGIFELFGRPVRLLRTGLLLFGGGLLAALIRPALLPLVVVAALAVPFVLLRDRATADRRLAVRATAVTATLLVLCGYVYVVNDRIDYAWGEQLAGQKELRGRALQQVGVIGALPWGKARLKKVARQVDADCVERMFIDPPSGTNPVTWRGELLQKCPSDTRRFADAVERLYVKGLLANPRRSLVDLWPALTDAFGPTPPDPQRFAPVPAPVDELWTSDPKAGTNPILLWALALPVLVGVALRRRGLGESPAVECSVVIVAGVAAGVLGVWVTAALSPLDTYRVASAPAMATRLLLLAGVAVLADQARHTRRLTKSV